VGPAGEVAGAVAVGPRGVVDEAVVVAGAVVEVEAVAGEAAFLADPPPHAARTATTTSVAATAPVRATGRLVTCRPRLGDLLVVYTKEVPTRRESEAPLAGRRLMRRRWRSLVPPHTPMQ